MRSLVMSEEDKKLSKDTTVNLILNLAKKKMDHDENAKKFIQTLSSLTDNFISHNNDESALEEMKALKSLFDSFAIVDEFNSSLIIDCYFEIKISLMKWKRFVNKTTSRAVEFKTILDQMYEVMDDLYHYEYFGFFSTTINPKSLPELKLPCHVYCGCISFWPREPYLTEEGKVAYENVIRFRDPGNENYFCITISDNPCLLESREKCTLTDEQLESIKSFVSKNKDIIIVHAMDYIALDSGDLFDALKFKNSAEPGISTYRIAYSCKMHLGNEIEESNIRYVGMNNRSYKEAVKLHKHMIAELKANIGKAEQFDLADSYKLISLKILKPKNQN